jgi:hypothetical protein
MCSTCAGCPHQPEHTIGKHGDSYAGATNKPSHPSTQIENVIHGAHLYRGSGSSPQCAAPHPYEAQRQFGLLLLPQWQCQDTPSDCPYLCSVHIITEASQGEGSAYCYRKPRRPRSGRKSKRAQGHTPTYRWFLTISVVSAMLFVRTLMATTLQRSGRNGIPLALGTRASGRHDQKHLEPQHIA